MTDEDIIAGILDHEGGYTDDHLDHGGPTNWGVTLEALSEWRNQVCSADDVRKLTRGEAQAIYRQRYIRGPGFDLISDAKLRAILVDCAVLHGITRAKVWFQRGLGVEADGDWGPETMSAFAKADPRKLYLVLCGIRIRFFGDLLATHPDQVRFARGWTDRAADFVEAA